MNKIEFEYEEILKSKITPVDVKKLIGKAYDLSNTEEYNVIINYNPNIDNLWISIRENDPVFGQGDEIADFSIDLQIRKSRYQSKFSFTQEYNRCWCCLRELENILYRKQKESD